jgi:hypothetical protein
MDKNIADKLEQSLRKSTVKNDHEQLYCIHSIAISLKRIADFCDKIEELAKEEEKEELTPDFP